MTRYISIAISTYEMGGHGAEFLKHNFDIFTKQTFTDFDVVISDQSKNDAIQRVCDEYKDRLDIHYFKINEKASASDNTNNAIKNATGKLIKILFLDDFFYHEKSLEDIVKNFDLEKDGWLVTACIHTKDGRNFFRPFHPRYDDAKIIHKNTLSAPSVVTIKNDNPILFDQPLVWWQDIDFYKRNYARFGAPKILDDINVVIRVHAAQMSNTMATERQREHEYHYVLKKYNVPNAQVLALIYKMKKWKRWLKDKIKKSVSGSVVKAYVKTKIQIRDTMATAYYSIESYPLVIRQNTSDLDVFKQVFIDKQYNIDFGDIHPKLIIDGGANVGYTSVFLAKKFPNANIFSIEPETSNFKTLQKNTKPYNQIYPLKKGLWPKKARLKIVNQNQGEWAFMTKEVGPSEDHDVDTITVEDVLKMSGQKNIDILKLDIEGAEKELFSNNYDSWLGKVDMLIIELHDRMKKGSSEAFYSAIKKYKFKQEIYGENVILRKTK